MPPSRQDAKREKRWRGPRTRELGPQRPGGPPSGDDGEVVQGLRACLAVFDVRREDVTRMVFAPELARELSAVTRWCRSRQVPCHEATAAELDAVGGSPHHEGVCVVTRPRRWASASELADALVARAGTAIALDRVRNPYNVGAILRTAAFFGVTAAVLGAPAPHPALAPMAVRVAEGGAEHLLLSRTTDLADTLGRLRARGIQVVGADGHAPASVYDVGFARPAILVMGHEREGLGERVRKQCTAIVSVPGGGAIESLNVGVAAGILMAEMVRWGRGPAKPRDER
jgi:TrmH RNA methyltransferase